MLNAAQMESRATDMTCLDKMPIKKLKTIHYKYLVLFLFFSLLIPSLAFSQVAGKITLVEGRVDILRAGTVEAVPARVGDTVSIGDILRTKSDGRAEITFIDNSVMTVGPKSRLGIEEYLYKPEAEKREASVKLFRGRTGFKIPKPVYSAEGSKFEMKTRTATAGVRGTEGILLTGMVDRVYVREGVIEFANPIGKVTVTAGKVGESIAGRPPTERPYSEKEFSRQQEGVKPEKPSDKKSEGEAKQGEKTASKSEGAPPPPPDVPPPPPPPPPISSVTTGPGAVAPPAAGQTKLPVTEGTGATSTSTNVNINIIHPQ